MRVLVFCDDVFHLAATVRAGLAPLATGQGLEFDWVEDATDWPPSALADYPVALLAKSNVRSHADHALWLNSATEGIFRDHVARGGGLVVVHSGIATYKNVMPVRTVMGGAFVSHPPPCPVTIEPQPGHPLTAGIAGPFTVQDEHYQVVLDDGLSDVFLYARSVHGVQPAGWTRQDSGGRVCVLTPGHFPEVWLHPSFQRLLSNALQWVAPIAG